MELLIVVAIILVLLASAVPLISNAMRTHRLRVAGVDYANLLQNARMRAVQGDEYVQVLTPFTNGSVNNSAACVDLNQDADCDAPVGNEPAVYFDPTVQIQAPGGAPAQANLRSQYLPSTCGASAACVTIDPNNTAPSGPVFGARGLPCYLNGGVCSYNTSAAGINGAGGSAVPVAFETYFQNVQDNDWEAVTVSPAGRIREWSYDPASTSWKALN